MPVGRRVGHVVSVVARRHQSTAPSINPSKSSNAFTSAVPVRDKGLNVAIKDNICTTEFPTTCASSLLKDFRSPYDATVVKHLRSQGHFIVGKTNMDEFGMGSHSTHSHYGPVTTEGGFSAGGSSGGSAMAVADGDCQAALGTDTGGSVRLPAAYCGVYGFKPSYGRLSRWGVISYANSLDTVGFLAREPESIRRLYHYTNRYDPKDPTSMTTDTRKRSKASGKRAGTKNLRIGVPIEYNIAELSGPVRQAWSKFLHDCRCAGHTIVPISLPTTKHALSAYYVLAPAEASSNLAKYDGVRYGTRADAPDGSEGVLFSRTRGEGFGDEVKRRILLGSYTLSAEAIDNYFIQAQKVRRLVQQDFNRVFRLPNPLRTVSSLDQNEAGVDFIVCPTAPTLAPSLEDVEKQTPVQSYMNDVFTVPASLAGLPAMSVPRSVPIEARNGKVRTGNVGIQIIGQYGDDIRVIRLADEIGKQ